VLTRRAFLGATFASTLACTKPKASGFSGYAFVANEEGQAVAAVDLTVFAVSRHIHLSGHPTSVVAHPRLSSVYALTPENGTVHEIRSDTLAFSRKAQLASSAISMRLTHSGGHLYVLCREPRKLVRFAVDSFQPDWQVVLPAIPVDFDIDEQDKWIAVSYGPERILSLIQAADQSAGQSIHTGGEIGTVRFQGDSSQLIAANLTERMLAFYQVASRRLVVNLPLAVRPDNLCFNADGGQLFVTGDGGDAVVVVYPYFIPEIGETVLAGHAPGAMASTRTRKSSVQYLFVANRKSGDVSILDITTRRLIAVTPVGTDPNHITITPDDEYALVLNQGSGDMAVLRIPNITRAVSDYRRSRKGPIFRMIPVGSKPVSAAILPI
jgi:YVTN family beta-propeller protein